MEPNYLNEIINNNMLQYSSVVHDNLITVEPVTVVHVDDGHGSFGPLVHIGYLGGEPIYRTTHTVAHYMEGNQPGQFHIYWPPLFPNVWLPVCEYMQLDVSIRTEDGPGIPPVENEDNDDEDVTFWNYDAIGIYDSDELDSISDEMDIDWVNVDVVNSEWINVDIVTSEWDYMDNDKE
ncbi:unnamed protein product [Adineta steineri]|uniref:Uncharacterized protein n=1 Tax=Adineta steineri TaxID=433720 RepID=A0A815P0Q1_9BILA|nr:unnamed protein product [Adineta steineri]CAF3957895.1 unnamed protein product [Adineta steineri]